MKKIYNLPYFPFLLLLAAALAMHINLPVVYDDAMPGNLAFDMPFFDRLQWIYFNWSSRLLIYAVGSFFLHHKILWALVNSAVFVVAAALLSYLFADIKNRKYNLLACALVLVYPFYHMASTGYVSTTINYLWPLVCALVAFIPIKKYYLRKPMTVWEYPLYALAALYAANSEQVAVILFIVYTVFVIRERAFKSFLSAQALLVLASLIFILTCPGNYARFTVELADIEKISLFAQIKSMIVVALRHAMFRPNFSFLLFAVLLVWAQRRGRAVAAVPLAVLLIFGFFGAVSGLFGLPLPLRGSESIAALFVLLAAAGCGCAALFTAFENRQKAWLCILILLMGFAGKFITAVVLGAEGSSNRTYIFMHFAFLICALLLFVEVDKRDKTGQNRFYALLSLCVFSSFIMFYAYNATKYIELAGSEAYGKARILIEKIGIN